jgi:hypothetical protein
MAGKEEYIRIKNSRQGVASATGSIRVVEYKDSETGMTCLYAPSIDIHSYGDNFDEARSMFDETVKHFFDALFNSSRSKIQSELFRLGWSKKPFKQKEFTPTVDIKAKIEGEGIKNYKISNISLPKAA